MQTIGIDWGRFCPAASRLTTDNLFTNGQRTTAGRFSFALQIPFNCKSNARCVLAVGQKLSARPTTPALSRGAQLVRQKIFCALRFALIVKAGFEFAAHFKIPPLKIPAAGNLSSAKPRFSFRQPSHAAHTGKRCAPTRRLTTYIVANQSRQKWRALKSPLHSEPECNCAARRNEFVSLVGGVTSRHCFRQREICAKHRG